MGNGVIRTASSTISGSSTKVSIFRYVPSPYFARENKRIKGGRNLILEPEAFKNSQEISRSADFYGDVTLDLLL